jgi:hypothetical protein
MITSRARSRQAHCNFTASSTNEEFISKAAVKPDRAEFTNRVRSLQRGHQPRKPACRAEPERPRCEVLHVRRCMFGMGALL